MGGPGIFDMKTGLAQGIWALKLARETGAPLPTVTFLFNGDEEIGSLSSRPVIEELAQRADVTLVLEPSAHGAVKTARKGTGIFQVTATGVESHAGLAPQDGASAITALSEFVVAAAKVAAPDKGTTINTGLFKGGSAINVVAGQATAGVDIRVSSAAEQARVDEEFDAIEVSDPRVRIDIDHAWNRPPMTLNSASAPLLDLAREVARDQGRGHLPRHRSRRRQRRQLRRRTRPAGVVRHGCGGRRGARAGGVHLRRYGAGADGVGRGVVGEVDGAAAGLTGSCRPGVAGATRGTAPG